MSQNNNILNELSSLGSSLAHSNPQNIYEAPMGYFDGLADQMLNRVRALDAAGAADEIIYLSSLVGNISRQMPFAVPAGYFENVAARILEIVKSNAHQSAKEELESLSPLLSGLKKEMPFSVPAGYFENLSAAKNEVAASATAKVVSLTGRKWFRYAVAAVVVGIIATTSVFYFNHTHTDQPSDVKVLASFTKDVKKMDETQKDNLIELIEPAFSGKETAAVNSPVKTGTKEVKELLQDVSDQELNDFQQQTEDVKDVMMTN